jgi:hypothetical protein
MCQLICCHLASLTRHLLKESSSVGALYRTVHRTVSSSSRYSLLEAAIASLSPSACSTNTQEQASHLRWVLQEVWYPGFPKCRDCVTCRSDRRCTGFYRKSGAQKFPNAGTVSSVDRIGGALGSTGSLVLRSSQIQGLCQVSVGSEIRFCSHTEPDSINVHWIRTCFRRVGRRHLLMASAQFPVRFSRRRQSGDSLQRSSRFVK